MQPTKINCSRKNLQCRAGGDRPATAKKKRGKRKKKDLRKWLANCDLAAALEATANPHSEVNPDEAAKPTSVATQKKLGNEAPRSVEKAAPGNNASLDQAAPKAEAPEAGHPANVNSSMETNPDEAAETEVAHQPTLPEDSRTVQAAPEDVACRCDACLCSCAGGSIFWVGDYEENFLGCSGSYPDMKAKYDLHQDLLLSTVLRAARDY